MPITVTLTPRATAFAGSDAETLKGLILDDYLTSCFEEDDRPEEISSDTLLFHTMEYKGHEYILSPVEKNVLIIDLCDREELAPLKEGPFKGKIIQMPRGASDD